MKASFFYKWGAGVQININTSLMLTLLLLTTSTHVFAIDPQQEYERERRKIPRPATKESNQTIPSQLSDSVRDRQERQRREAVPPMQHTAGFNTPNIISIDRLKLSSTPISEQQFESVQTITFQQYDSSSTNDEKNEIPQKNNDEILLSENTEIIPSDPVSEDIVDVNLESKKTTVVTSNINFFTITEDNDKIIVTQIEETVHVSSDSNKH